MGLFTGVSRLIRYIDESNAPALSLWLSGRYGRASTRSPERSMDLHPNSLPTALFIANVTLM